MIGSLGEVIFEVSAEKILTFDGLQFSHSAKYSEHAVHGRKGLLEFTGFSASTLSMNITLNSNLGINPKKELENLKEIFFNHEAVLFILDGEPQGENLWVIESLSEKHDNISKHGASNYIEVSLNLKEYIEVNQQNSSNNDFNFENDYYGVGNF